MIMISHFIDSLVAKYDRPKPPKTVPKQVNMNLIMVFLKSHFPIKIVPVIGSTQQRMSINVFRAMALHELCSHFPNKYCLCVYVLESNSKP